MASIVARPRQASPCLRRFSSPVRRRGAANGPRATAAASACAPPIGSGRGRPTRATGSGPEYDYQTLRVIVTPHYAGDQLRVHLSNRFGSRAGDIRRGDRRPPQAAGASVVGGHQPAAHLRRLVPDHRRPRARTSSAIRCQPDLQAFQELAVSLYVSGDSRTVDRACRRRRDVLRHTRRIRADATAADAATAFTMTTTRTSFVDGLDVLAPGSVSALVGIGDSITDGIESFVVPATPERRDRRQLALHRLPLAPTRRQLQAVGRQRRARAATS